MAQVRRSSWWRWSWWCVGTIAVAAWAGASTGEEGPPQELTPSEVLKEADGTEFRFSYLPSQNCVRFVLLAPATYDAAWELDVTAVGDSQSLVHAEGRLPFPAAGQTLAIPELDAGEYEATLTLITPDGGRRELRRRFERQRFPWEGCALGRDRVVIPPFTPLTVEQPTADQSGDTNVTGPAVCCVLRRHELDGTGLWRQVLSQDRALLAAPMRLELVTAGETHVATGTGVVFSETADDRVQGRASWTAGPIAGQTELTFDYDGLMLTTLHIEPAGVRLDAMQLVIPLRTAETWLMHPVTDLLRFHYAGRIPDGRGKLWEYDGQTRDVQYTDNGRPDADGRVWDSGQVGRWQLPAPFVPYIWLGGPERGICWCAENDRDWSLDPDRPMLEIRRRGEATELIVRFVTWPIDLTRPRAIVFGLMATPAKPMPRVPVDFRRWWAGSMAARTTDTVHFGVMGAGYYWGTSGPCFAFYPARRDFRIYDELVRVRRTGQVDPGYLDRWLAQFTAPEHAPLLDEYRASINWSFHFFSDPGWREGAAAGKTAYAIPYTNARGVNWGEEVRTFADEWSTIDIADPRWPGEERFLRTPDGGWAFGAYRKLQPLNDTAGIAYATDPVESWQDMVLFYVQRMLETFADGVYFDDFFLVANYNPLGPGYVDDQGQPRPGVNLFGFRQLAKRIAVMQHQMGQRPLSFLHMTNTNIVPMLSFGTLLLDHEWRDQGDYQAMDFHERLSLDDDTSLLLAQSTGFQSGCIGVIHDLLRGPERDRFIRSGLAVALTHEMKFPLYWEELGRTIAEHLSNFGYGRDDCRVYRYWDETVPVQTAGAAAKTLVLSRHGQALIVVGSFGPAGDVTLTLDLAALGLPARATAVNLETGEAVLRVGPGRFQFPLPRHDFRLIRVGG